jgi:hypothetical protein
VGKVWMCLVWVKSVPPRSRYAAPGWETASRLVVLHGVAWCCRCCMVLQVLHGVAGVAWCCMVLHGVAGVAGVARCCMVLQVLHGVCALALPQSSATV